MAAQTILFLNNHSAVFFKGNFHGTQPHYLLYRCPWTLPPNTHGSLL